MPLFQNESKCETFHMKMSSACSFIIMQIKVILHKNSFAKRLALKQWHKGTRKWPIKTDEECLVTIPRGKEGQNAQEMKGWRGQRLGTTPS